MRGWSKEETKMDFAGNKSAKDRGTYLLSYPQMRERSIANKFIDDEDPAGESVCPDQMASGGIGGFGPKYFSISALLRPKAFFVKSHRRVGRFRITFRRRSTRFCQYL